MSSAPSNETGPQAPGTPPPVLAHFGRQDFYVYSRDQLAAAFGCTHVELGRLLRDKVAPLPIRYDGTVYWFLDEVEKARASVVRTLERWRRRR